jgi:hypothetical protein
VDALDGNAIAGALHEVYGEEMTMVSGRCRFCGGVSRIGQLRVYMRAPGAVGRCPICANVVLVLTSIHGSMRAAVPGFELRT